VSWESHIPDGVSNVEKTPDGFTGTVSIHPDEDGYIGRRCDGCDGKFRMLVQEYNALPDDAELICPYCGNRAHHSEFMTVAQRERAYAAAEVIGSQYIQDMLDDIMGRTFGSRQSARSSSPFSVEFSYTPRPRPAPRPLPEVVEDRARRIIVCPGCGTHYAVYSTSAFCPVCGPRAAADTVLEQIAAGRAALAVEDHLPPAEADAARDAGVFEAMAANTLKSIVTLFEVFARDQFNARASNAAAAVKGKGNVFQRLDDTAQLFNDHCAIDLPAATGATVWQRLREDFARRHVLTHCDGIVDAKFLVVVTNTGLQVGQRLVISRQDAERALDDVENVVQTLAAMP
jgi:rubrerythrin